MFVKTKGWSRFRAQMRAEAALARPCSDRIAQSDPVLMKLLA
jgi:hypothetical protein